MGDSPTDQDSEARGVVHVGDLYRCGTYDFLDLATTIKMIYDAGNQDVKRILTRRLMLSLNREPAVKTSPIKAQG